MKNQISQTGAAFVALWKAKGFEYLYVGGAEVELGDLHLKVEPNLGIRTQDGKHVAVKTWLSVDSYKSPVRDVFYYLLGLVKEKGFGRIATAWGFGTYCGAISTIRPWHQTGWSATFLRAPKVFSRLGFVVRISAV